LDKNNLVVLTLFWLSSSDFGIKDRRNTEVGQQGKITFLNSSSHAGPLVARSREGFGSLAGPTLLLPLLFRLSMHSMAIG